MELSDLIERGYFPKELPPPFNTKSLALNIKKVLAQWESTFINNTDTNKLKATYPGHLTKEQLKTHKSSFISQYKSSKCCIFSISKGKLSRRLLQIPNPHHFTLLSEKIISHWSTFENIFLLSEFSQSYPIIETNLHKRSVSTASTSVSVFRNNLLKKSVGKKILLKIDISKFYPSIYTHSLTWAILGKVKAKKYFKCSDILGLVANGDTDAELYLFANELDSSLRNCQECQSVGIPIGPDTSHILAETIACRIDYILKTEHSDIQLSACRYYDDYYIYVTTKDEADRILKKLQLILSDFQLEINENKVVIKEFPFSFEDEFTTNLFLFTFKSTNINYSLKHYFSLIWGYAEKYPTKMDWIFKYSLRTFESGTTIIPQKSWRLFENLLFKTALIEPSILDIVTRILLTYNSYIDTETKEGLKNLIEDIINSHHVVKHNFEISWALWLAKTFEIQIRKESAQKIIKTKDNIANLILLDLYHNTHLTEKPISFNELEEELKDNILISENWLLAYESIKKGWLTPSDPNLIDNNLFFKILKDLNVEFYNPKKQIYTYKDIENKKPSISISSNNILIKKTIQESENLTKPIVSFIMPSGLDF